MYVWSLRTDNDWRSLVTSIPFADGSLHTVAPSAAHVRALQIPTLVGGARWGPERGVALSLLLLSCLLFCDSAFLVSHLCHTNKGTPSYKLRFAGIHSFIVIYYSNILVLLSLFSLRITDNWIKGKRNRQYVAPCFSSCGPWTMIIGIIWEPVRTADPEAQSLRSHKASRWSH